MITVMASMMRMTLRARWECKAWCTREDSRWSPAFPNPETSKYLNNQAIAPKIKIQMWNNNHKKNTAPRHSGKPGSRDTNIQGNLGENIHNQPQEQHQHPTTNHKNNTSIQQPTTGTTPTSNNQPSITNKQAKSKATWVKTVSEPKILSSCSRWSRALLAGLGKEQDTTTTTRYNRKNNSNKIVLTSAAVAKAVEQPLFPLWRHPHLWNLQNKLLETESNRLWMVCTARCTNIDHSSDARSRKFCF